MWTIQIERSFQKSFRSLDEKTSRRVVDFITKHQDGIKNPFTIPAFRLLVGQANRGRFRLGEYRIGVTLDHQTETIHLRFVGARGDFYKRFR